MQFSRYLIGLFALLFLVTTVHSSLAIDQCPSLVNQFKGLNYTTTSCLDINETYYPSEYYGTDNYGEWSDFNYNPYYNSTHGRICLKQKTATSGVESKVKVNSPTYEVGKEYDINSEEADLDAFSDGVSTTFGTVEKQDARLESILILNSTHLNLTYDYSVATTTLQYANSTYTSSISFYKKAATDYDNAECMIYPHMNSTGDLSVKPPDSFNVQFDNKALPYDFKSFFYTYGNVEYSWLPEQNDFFLFDTGNFDSLDFDETNSKKQFCKAYLVGDDELLTPMITFTPDMSADYGKGYVTTGLYDRGGDFAFIPNSTVTYIYDNTYHQWWLVPSFRCDSLKESATVVYMLRVPESEQGIGTLDYPPMPSQSYCGEKDDNYIINYTYNNDQKHIVTWEECQNGTNCTVYSYNETTSDFDYNHTIHNNTTSINYYSTTEQNLECSWSNDTSIFGMQQLNLGTKSDMNWIYQIIFVLLNGLGIAFPVFLIFPLIWNSAFAIIPKSIMGGLFVFEAIGGSIIRWQGDRSLKQALFLVGFGVAYIGYVFVSGAGLAVDTPTGAETYLTDVMTHWEGTVNTMVTEPSFTNMIIGTFTLVISLFKTLLFLPHTLLLFVQAILASMSPTLGSAFGTLVPVLSILIYGYIILKAYEVLSDKFQPI